eukprot:NODE_1185_length_2571_cov_13.087971.p1 GENE.NODE_1185_length_2571_cov_13.087971~~NODE_1185_length_2571_cov_13.087971.p1  ORF type:complete len:694 (-),score=108.55 NODE_1185_length_2571_cov_13.087971:300-2381(-)
MDIVVGEDVAEIGLHFDALSPEPRIVQCVDEGSWADENGVLPGDAILELNGHPVDAMAAEDFMYAMRERPIVLKVGWIEGHMSPMQPNTSNGSSGNLSRGSSINGERSRGLPRTASAPPRMRARIASDGGDFGGGSGGGRGGGDTPGGGDSTSKSASIRSPPRQYPPLSADGESFRTELLHQARQESHAAAWRVVLDPCGTGRLRLADFCEVCRHLGYKGNIRKLWQEFDVEGMGEITLSDYDWFTGHLMARFHTELGRRFGSARKAILRLGMTGTRILSYVEFCRVVRGHRLLGGSRSAQDAPALFRMMVLSHAGSPPVCTPGDFMWLASLSGHLPHRAPRVEPGTLGEPYDPSSEAKHAEQEGLRTPEHVGMLWGESDGESGYDGGGDIGSQGRTGDVYQKLYGEAMNHHQRRDELHAGPPPQDEKQHVNPEHFLRLHEDDKIRREARKTKEEAFYRSMLPISPKKGDPAARERLLKPRAREASAPVVRTGKGGSSGGVAEKTPRPMATATAAGPIPERVNNLYNDHKLRQERKEVSRKLKNEEQDAEIQKMQKDYGSRKANPDTFDRLYSNAAEMARRRQEALLEQESKRALLEAPPTKGKGVAKLETFARLYLDGRHRDKLRTYRQSLCEMAVEKNLEKTSIHRNASRDPHVFDRLYANRLVHHNSHQTCMLPHDDGYQFSPKHHTVTA